jgi:hypothetical protein
MRLSVSFYTVALAVSPVYGQAFVERGWMAFGDSFSAGPGAGANYFSSGGGCQRREGAFPSQLDDGAVLSRGYPNHLFDFVTCSGARIADVYAGQLDEFRDNTVGYRDFATISIGGNDVGFSNTLDACVFYAKQSDCEA